MDTRPLATIAALAAAVLLTAGCADTPTQPKDTPTSEVSASTVRQYYQFGQTATVTGEGGGQIKVTPLGVLYHRGPYTSGVEGPENGWFVAVALKAEAVTTQDRFVAPAYGGGFRWRGQGQTIWSGEGNATATPWIGAVPEFGDPIEPGSPETGIETFDVPAKESGRLLYINADQTLVSWYLPAADTGTGLDKVRARIKEFS